jgi:hypothetical protein
MPGVVLGHIVELIQVGLPARGKSYLSNKLMRYLKVRLVVIYINTKT